MTTLLRYTMMAVMVLLFALLAVAYCIPPDPYAINVISTDEWFRSRGM